MSLASRTCLGAFTIAAVAGVLAIAVSCAPAAPVPSESHEAHQTPAAPADRADTAVRINTDAAPEPAPKDMVWVPGGTFWMGCEGCGMPDALPSHLVEVDGF